MIEKQNIDFFKKEAVFFCSKKEQESDFFSVVFLDEVNFKESVGKIVFENKCFAVQEISSNNSLIIDKSKVKIMVWNDVVNKFVEKYSPEKILGKICFISRLKNEL